MTPRARRSQGNRDKDAAYTAIAFNVLRSLVTLVTQSMTTAIVNATFPGPVNTKTTTYYSAINLYDNELSETKTEEGKYQWHFYTKTAEGWKKDGISATVDHADNILDLFKDRSV